MSAIVAGRGADQAATDALGRLVVVVDRLEQLVAGSNEVLGQLETTPAGVYTTGVGATSASDIFVGSGKAGNKLHAISVYNNSGSAITAFDIKDGTTVLSALDLGSLRTLASGSRAVWTAPGGALEGKNTGWRINITCAGTMANIAFLAVISE